MRLKCKADDAARASAAVRELREALRKEAGNRAKLADAVHKMLQARGEELKRRAEFLAACANLTDGPLMALLGEDLPGADASEARSRMRREERLAKGQEAVNQALIVVAAEKATEARKDLEIAQEAATRPSEQGRRAGAPEGAALRLEKAKARVNWASAYRRAVRLKTKEAARLAAADVEGGEPQAPNRENGSRVSHLRKEVAAALDLAAKAELAASDALLAEAQTQLALAEQRAGASERPGPLKEREWLAQETRVTGTADRFQEALASLARAGGLEVRLYEGWQALDGDVLPPQVEEKKAAKMSQEQRTAPTSEIGRLRSIEAEARGGVARVQFLHRLAATRVSELRRLSAASGSRAAETGPEGPP